MPADGCLFLDTHYEYLDSELVFSDSEGLYIAWREEVVENLFRILQMLCLLCYCCCWYVLCCSRLASVWFSATLTPPADAPNPERWFFNCRLTNAVRSGNKMVVPSQGLPSRRTLKQTHRLFPSPTVLYNVQPTFLLPMTRQIMPTYAESPYTSRCHHLTPR